MTVLRSEAIERFPVGADQEVKRKFAQDLVKALDELRVSPGDTFLVVREDEEDKINERIGALEEDLATEQALAEDYRSLAEKVEDFGRGIVTADELLEAVGVRR